MKNIKYSYKDQDWDRETTTYWFEVETEDTDDGEPMTELIGIVEGNVGYNHIINEYGNLILPEELDVDLIVTDEMRMS